MKHKKTTIILWILVVNFFNIIPVQATPHSVEITFISGNDCLEYHGNVYVLIIPTIEEFTNDSFSIAVLFTSKASNVYYNYNLTNVQYPTNISSTKSKFNGSNGDQYVDTKFTMVFSPIVTDGIIEIDFELMVGITGLPIHTGYEGFYGLAITFDLTQTRDNSFNISIDLDLFNQILSYITLISISIMIIFGTKNLDSLINRIFQKKIYKKDLIKIHKLMGEITAILAILHLLLSTFSDFWKNIINFWPFPTLKAPNEISSLFLFDDYMWGLETGRWVLLIMGFSFITGLYHKYVIRSIGKKFSILTQQISYFGLILLLWHSLSTGRLVKEIPTLSLVVWLSILLPLGIKLFTVLYKNIETNRNKLNS